MGMVYYKKATPEQKEDFKKHFTSWETPDDFHTLNYCDHCGKLLEDKHFVKEVTNYICEVTYKCDCGKYTKIDN